VAASGAHVRGVLGAMVFNSFGFVVVQQLTGATPATAAGLVTIMAGMTLWAFLGVLVLPTPSRAAVYAADAAAAAVVGTAAVKASIERLDQWQDDEPTRAPTIERIFHPVPSRANRLARLERRKAEPMRGRHAHHLARHALWLGWGGFSAISRAVHCNVGRSALWAMLPGD
jgi:Zn-dependent protease with chaperone function